ncbi:hypothetical protein [Roseovarius sp. 2305UL8-3]|uniref:hypothetical protein n=1 Tax=Roseovarius conchicola TaxID=3121636 RepID=UPI003526D925
MNIQKLKFADIRYNPEISAFETRVTIHENGVAYVYPVHLCAALTAEFPVIARGLTEKAHKMHGKRQNSLYLHHPLGDTGMFSLHAKAA